MSKNNRERQAEFKQRMREAGKKQITIWVTQEQEQQIRALLANEDDVNVSACAAPSEDSAPVKGDEEEG